MATAAATTMKELFEKYKKFVENNVETIGHVESAARILSYVTPGGSATTSEFLSAIVNLVVLLHDSIIRNAARIPLHFSDGEKKAAFCLTVIDYVEVFLEMAAWSGNGHVMRWLVIASVQLIKAALRFLLLIKYNSGIIANSPVPTLRRNKDLFVRLREQRTATAETVQQNNVTSQSPLANGDATFSLQSTGRTVRSLSAGHCTSSVLSQNIATGASCSLPLRSSPTRLNDQQKLAEMLHILRPLFHLVSLYMCGQSSWKPWLIACGIDMSSLYLMGDSSQLNAVEREELKRRTLTMLLYLLRSPFYDQYSKEKLLFFLGILAHKVPVVRRVVKPLLDYLPIWQQIYFYVWTV